MRTEQEEIERKLLKSILPLFWELSKQEIEMRIAERLKKLEYKNINRNENS